MADVTIKIRPSGPYLVTGPIELTDADGNPVAIPEGKTPSRCAAAAVP